MTILSVLTKGLVFIGPPSITNLRSWSLVAEGVGIVPPPIAVVSAANIPQLTDRVQHSLKERFESEEMPVRLSIFTIC